MFARFKHLTWKSSLLAAVVSSLALTIALAAPGDLDTTFSGDGLVTSFVVPSNTWRLDRVFAAAIQADGKIVVAGDSVVPFTPTHDQTNDFALIRYNTDGSLDTTFSGDGRLITNFGGRWDQAVDVVAQGNGKIVAAGVTGTSDFFYLFDLALTRYNSNGTLDPTFSGDGKQITDFGGEDNGTFGGLAIQPNGKIVVAGYMMNIDSDYEFAVYRYNANGSLDSNFSGDGMVNFRFGAGGQDIAYDLALRSDGKIVVAGYTYDTSSDSENFAIARLNANGTLDTTFSADGKQTTNMGGDDHAYSLALQTDGKIVVAGTRFVPATNIASFALARYNTDGSLDTTFNGTGRQTFSIISGANSGASNVVVQSDGKIVVVGYTNTGSGSNDFALVRLNPNGSLDTTFSTDGKVTVDFGNYEGAYDLALDANGKYVLGGSTDDGTQSDFAVARVLP